ncbi:ATP-binding protein [Geoalkalibacter halelectricus]|uniref:histidine kinase n=1 Tax=Geoalkalibacter halelectricus TaxID=2847045 RepID=A0ABY5ZLM3_9BACT|nr:ATP-binding protein [Geoalkalibacter halelectricus]MDO3377772.1 ATP-binding protein [Geoalkalibacter halelectricus]UWZ78634.1 ATP-binding protein [Geoalkalibacter halelectricus]
MSANSIRRHILLPLSFTLLLLLATFLFSIYRIKLQEVDAALAQNYEIAQTLSAELRHERAVQMGLVLELLARDPHLQQAMEAGDRAALLEFSRPLFEEVLLPNGISHLYFHQPDQRVLLRLHKPDFHGDLIGRHSLRQAAAENRLSSGVELGPLGTFTHRVVLPWYAAGDLVGYLEAGEDVDLFMGRLRQSIGIDYVVAVEKSYLDRELWEQGRALRARPADWNRFADHVILDQSLEILPEGFEQALNLDHDAHLHLSFELSLDERVLRGRLLPLRDARGVDVGDVLLLVDVTEKLALFNRSMWLGTLLTLGFGGVLFGFSYVMLGRTSQQLQEAQDRLMREFEATRQANDLLEEEMAERQRMEAALREARDDLELRVSQRTLELQQALHEAHQARERIDAILRSVGDGLLVVNESGEVLLANQAARLLLNLAEGKVVGRPLADLLRNQLLLERLRQALAAAGGEQVFDVELLDAQGARRIIEARTSAIHGQGQGRDGILVLCQDVTQARLIDRMKSEFISTVAHEFRTPLATVLGFSELLLSREDFTPEQRREFLTYIFEKADALAAIVDDLLDLSRIESGREIELRKEPSAPDQLFLPVIRDFRLQHPDAEFEVALAPSAADLLVDRRKSAQVMENLLSNAVKYSPGKRRVKISGYAEGAYYQVLVRDWGMGMTPEQQARVFEKFYRADSSNVAVSGTGLGMSIVKHIVEAHGGRVWLESAPGEGTSVYFTLPLAIAVPNSPEHASSARSLSPS